MNTNLINQAAAFIWQEADMLDHAEYEAWLNLWTADGLYIVPIDPAATDFTDTLNYAYDDSKMRKLRVARLTSGESVSSTPGPAVVRSASRFRILADDGRVVTVRSAQNLREFNKDHHRHYTANVTYELVREGDGFRIQRKVIRLVNSTHNLQAIAYIL